MKLFKKNIPEIICEDYFVHKRTEIDYTLTMATANLGGAFDDEKLINILELIGEKNIIKINNSKYFDNFQEGDDVLLIYEKNNIINIISL